MKLDEREQYWLDFYKAYKPEYGYNLRLKAESNRGYKFSIESIKKRTESRKYYTHSKETREKIAKGNKGKKRNKEQLESQSKKC